jgi:hypothetical protein
MKNENYYRKLFKKEHDSLIGKGDNIQNVMTEDCFVRVIKKLTLTDNVKIDSELFFCCKQAIDQRCSEQCLGCYTYKRD